MIDDKIEKYGNLVLTALMWGLLYIILGFEVTVVALLLLILVQLRN